MRWLRTATESSELLTTYSLVLSVIAVAVMLALVFLGPIQSTYYTDCFAPLQSP